MEKNVLLYGFGCICIRYNKMNGFFFGGQTIVLINLFFHKHCSNSIYQIEQMMDVPYSCNQSICSYFSSTIRIECCACLYFTFQNEMTREDLVCVRNMSPALSLIEASQHTRAMETAILCFFVLILFLFASFVGDIQRYFIFCCV